MNMSPEFRHLEQATLHSAMHEFFARHLSRCLPAGGELYEVRVTRVFPRGRGGFVIQYELVCELPGTPHRCTRILCGELLPRGFALPGYVRKHADRVLVDADLGLVVPLFPFDPELPALPDWADGGRAQKRLHAALGSLGEPWNLIEHAIEPVLLVLAYRLGRRCTIRYDLGPADTRGSSPKSVIGRISRPGSLALRKIVPFLEQIPESVPDEPPKLEWVRALLTLDLEGIELLPLAPGRSLHDLIEDPSVEHAFAAAGRILARIHGHSAESLPVRSGSGDEAGLRRQVSLACTIFPSCASLFEEAMNAWAAKKTMGPIRNSLVHGDFYDKQVLYSAEQVTVVDYDALASGEPAMDIGNFMAHITLRRMQHPVSAAHLERGRSAFEKAYPVLGGDFQERCRFWENATLIRLAALYALRPRWRHITVPLLEECRQCLVLK